MKTLSLNDLITLLQSLRHYQAHLEQKLETLTDDDKDYGATVDELEYVEQLIPKIEDTHQEMYRSEIGVELG